MLHISAERDNMFLTRVENNEIFLLRKRDRWRRHQPHPERSSCRRGSTLPSLILVYYSGVMRRKKRRGQGEMLVFQQSPGGLLSGLQLLTYSADMSEMCRINKASLCSLLYLDTFRPAQLHVLHRLLTWSCSESYMTRSLLDFITSWTPGFTDVSTSRDPPVSLHSWLKRTLVNVCVASCLYGLKNVPLKWDDDFCAWCQCWNCWRLCF